MQKRVDIIPIRSENFSSYRREKNKKLKRDRYKNLDFQQADKKSLRLFYRQRLAGLPSSLKKQKEKQIAILLNQLPFWKEEGFIAVYRALKDEPCCSSFYSLWKDKICFPVVQGERLEFYKSKAQWKQNSFKVLEPVAEPKNKVFLKDISVFLVPGRAFDRNGGRLGRGRAYYDKTLSQTNRKDRSFKRRGQALFVGLAFSDQIHNEPLPLSSHDVLLDLLVTDRFVLMPLKRGKGFIYDF